MTKLRPGTREIWRDRISATRRFFGMSLRDVARQAGVAPSTVLKYERIGPPSLRAAVTVHLAIYHAHARKHGGFQLDFEASRNALLQRYRAAP